MYLYYPLLTYKTRLKHCCLLCQKVLTMKEAVNTDTQCMVSTMKLYTAVINSTLFYESSCVSTIHLCLCLIFTDKARPLEKSYIK